MLHSCLILVVCLAPNEPPEASAEMDQKALQGKWAVTRMEMAGSAWTEEALKAADITVEFDGTTMKFVKKGKNLQTNKFKLDSDKSPKTIDTVDAEGRVEKGIYELTEKTLRICTAQTGNPRPTEFKSGKKPVTSLITLERVSE